MKSKSSAPGKVILFGEHFVVYGIQAILCAIDKRVYVTAEQTNDNKISIISDIGSLCVLPHTPISDIDSPLKPLYYLADKLMQEQDVTDDDANNNASSDVVNNNTNTNTNNNNNNNDDDDDDDDDDGNDNSHTNDNTDAGPDGNTSNKMNNNNTNTATANNNANNNRPRITGIRVTVESEIPLGVGLGSSSACCVAGAAAISGLFKQASREDILHLAIQAERTIFENTSGADCTVCTYGGIITFDKEHGFANISPKSTFNLVIANSNLQHSTESIVAKVSQFKDDNPVLFSRLCDDEAKLVHDVLELLLLETGNNNTISELGQQVRRNQEYLEAIGVSNDTLRDMVRVGQTASFGAKLTGAGGGGCVFALTDCSNMQRTINQFQNSAYNCFPVDIDFKGLDTF